MRVKKTEVKKTDNTETMLLRYRKKLRLRGLRSFIRSLFIYVVLKLQFSSSLATFFRF